MSMSRIFAASLAAVLAVPAVAQSGASDAAGRAAGRQPATQAPAAAPAPGSAGATAQAQAGQMQLSAEQRQALATVAALNDQNARVGDLAATRAGTPELQGLGRQIAEDHRRFQTNITRFLAARGVENVASLPAAEKQRFDDEFMRLAAVSGAEFDKQFVDFLTRNGPMFVDSLKRARDVTPGKDAELKGYLDAAENEVEAHLTAARQAKSQRQARTPPRQ